MSADKFAVLSPVGEAAAQLAPSASRAQDLNGRTICQVSNGRFRADSVHAAFADLIRKRYPEAKVVPWNEFPIIEAMGDVDEELKALRQALRDKRCDAVVTSTGA